MEISPNANLRSRGQNDSSKKNITQYISSMNEHKIVKENILRLVNRNDLLVTGVEKVTSFSPTQIILTALDCEMQILGSGMQTTKLDEENGELVVSGLINSIKWTSKKEKLSLLKRIFK